MARNLVFTLFLTLILQTLTLSSATNVTKATTTTVVDPLITYSIKHMVRVRMIKLINEFNNAKKGFQGLIENNGTDYVSTGVSEIWKNDETTQAVEAFKIIIENNHFMYPKLRTYKSFDWLVKFIRQVNIGKSVLKNDSTLYKCLVATYTPCMAEAGKNRIAKVLQKFECSYRFFTDCKYDEFRVANPALRLLDFNSFSE